MRFRDMVHAFRVSKVVRKAFYHLVASVAGFVVGLFFDAWLVMLLIGIAHSYDVRVPDFGFATSFFLMLAVAVATYVGGKRKA